MDWEQFMRTLYAMSESIKAGDANELEAHRCWYEDGEPTEEFSLVMRRNSATGQQIEEFLELMRDDG